MKFSNIHPASESSFLPGILLGESIVMQISFDMLIFLLFSNQLFLGGGANSMGKLLEGKASSQPNNGLFHFLSVQGDGCKIPGLVKSMNFQRSTAKSPKIPGGWQHFATKFIEIEMFTLTDFSR